MATKTFSSGAESEALAYADSITREKFGMSFGQYCGSLLLEAVSQGAELPYPPLHPKDRKTRAIDTLKAFPNRPHNTSTGTMTNEQIDELIASRYE